MNKVTYNKILKLIISGYNANKILDYIEGNSIKNDDGWDFYEQLAGYVNVNDSNKLSVIVNKDFTLEVTDYNPNDKSSLTLIINN